jgi:two-component system, sensor histidine kinase and response regulator
MSLRTNVPSGLPPPAARVLAVDDAQANLLALEAVLEPLAMELVTAGSGEEALEQLARDDFAVVLLDMHMPGLDGFQTLARLRKSERSTTPVLFLTAFETTPQMRQRAYALGAFDFITKPIDVDALRGKVNAFIASYNRGRELKRQEDALRAKDRFLGVLAHDLRTPLAVVTFGARLLAEEPSDHVRKLAERIARSANRMQQLTHDLLEYARAAAQRMPMNPRDMNLAPLCRELVDDFSLSNPAVQFIVDAPALVAGTWDYDRLHQALANLLSNAAKYGDGHVSLTLQTDKQWAIVRVSNGGEPINAQRFETLFEAFEQGEDGSQGVGLGLFIVREIVAAHGGEVAVSSNRERTTFSVLLPLKA